MLAALIALGASGWLWNSAARAQVATPSGPAAEVAVPAGAPVAMPAGAADAEAAMRAAKERARDAKPGNPPDGGGKPPSEEAKPGDNKTPDAKSEGGNKSGPSEPVQRPNKPATPPNPDELKVVPDADGRVKFNFRGQPWPEVLEWLAHISGMTLDWQEVPGDYLNLSTQESYTLAEARDLINRHLLARGFTLLREGEMLTVVNLKKLDASLVPRVEPKELASRDPHEFVKVSFPLAWMTADPLAEELKPMLSPNGKLSALDESNRIEAMDAVMNLRDIYATLCDLQSPESQRQLVRPFKLQYAKAKEVRDQLLKLLGKNSSESAMPQDPQQAEQMRRMQQQMQQQQQQQGQNGKPPGREKKEPEVSIVAEETQNMILVHAPPDKMAIIEQAIDLLDVPVEAGNSLLANLNRMQVYRLGGVDPAPVVKTLEEIGRLDPMTRLEIDPKNNAIVAYAPLADHVTIRAIVDKLSGSERKFDVLQLRRLPADYVAGTIQFMVTGEKEQTQQRNPNYWWGGSSRDQTPDKKNQFRIDADVENNRLLVWANDIELAEVKNLLVKLGEISASNPEGAMVRVIDGGSPEQTRETLERLRQVWPRMAPNELLLPADEPKAAPRDKAAREKSSKEKENDDVPPSKTAAQPLATPLFHLAEMRRPAGESDQANAAGDPSGEAALATDAPAANKTEETPSARASVESASEADGATSPVADDDRRGAPARRPARSANGEAAAAQRPAAPPVEVTIDADGRLIVTSKDPAALDMIEQMLLDMAPPRKEFKIFQLKYAWAYGVTLNLQDFFKEDEDKQQRRPYYFYWGGDSQESSSNDRRLSKRKKLRFISDSDTNTILVEGADEDQLKIVEELINIYDQPPPSDSQSVRRTEVVQLNYAKAQEVCDTIKDVYRDLLSENDKALNDANRGSRETRYFFDYAPSDDGAVKAPKFKGLLSIGVNPSTNTLSISAPAFLFEPVAAMIRELDDAAAPFNTVRVVELGPGIGPDAVIKSLGPIIGDAKSGADSNNDERDRRRDEGRRSRDDRRNRD